MKKYIALIGLLIILILVVVGRGITSKKPEAENVPWEDTEERYEETSFPDAEEGDPGEDMEPRTIFDTIVPLAERPTRKAMQEIALSYDNQIPYMDGAKCYIQGYPALESGFDYTLLPEGSTVGMDSLGYTAWLYMNTFGSCPKEFENLEGYYEDCRIEEEELAIGDIGMKSLDGQNHYGICIGYEDGVAIFSHCSSEPKDKYPGGCTRLSYLKSQRDRFLLGNEPVDFSYFMRIPVEWEEEE